MKPSPSASTREDHIWSAIAFARSGNPATDRVGHWPAFNKDTRKVMCFDETTQLQDDPLEQEQELWEGIL